MTNLAENLKNYRFERRITQKELAEKIGVGQAIMSGYESGAKTPSIGTLKALADALEVTTDELLGRARL